jgi:hypothetical protein
MAESACSFPGLSGLEIGERIDIQDRPPGARSIESVQRSPGDLGPGREQKAEKKAQRTQRQIERGPSNREAHKFPVTKIWDEEQMGQIAPAADPIILNFKEEPASFPAAVLRAGGFLFR